MISSRYLLMWLVLVMGGADAWAATRRPSDTERGQTLYNRHCIGCHGERAMGDGPAAAALSAKVPAYNAELTKEVVENFSRLIMRGSGAMPSYELSFDREDATRVLRWMAKLRARRVVRANAPKDGAEAGNDGPPSGSEKDPSPEAPEDDANDDDLGDVKK